MKNKINKLILENDSVVKNYLSVNILFLILALYIIFLPLVSTILEKINPNLTKCVFLQITGKNCPLCGGTRYIENFSDIFSDITYIMSPFGLILIFVILQLIFRVVNIFLLVRKKYTINSLTKVVIIDFVINLLAFITFITYEIVYLINIF